MSKRSNGPSNKFRELSVHQRCGNVSCVNIVNDLGPLTLQDFMDHILGVAEADASLKLGAIVRVNKMMYQLIWNNAGRNKSLSTLYSFRA